MDLTELNDTLIAHEIIKLAEPLKHGLPNPIPQSALAEIMVKAATQYLIHRHLALSALESARHPAA